MFLEIYLTTSIVVAVRLIIVSIIIFILGLIWMEIIIWIKKDTQYKPDIFKHITGMILLFIMWAFIPSRKEMISIIVLSKLDAYIADHDITVTDTDAISNAGVIIENTIFRIDSDFDHKEIK